MNTKQLDDVAALVGVAIARALDPLRAELKALSERVSALPEAPKPVDLAPLTAQIDALGERVAELPAPAPGKDGSSVTVDDVRPLVEEAVTRAVAAIPVPAAGRDGVGVAGAMIDRAGNLQLTLSSGEVKDLGPVVGKDGASFDGFDFEYLPETHEIRAVARCAGREKEIRYDAGGIRNRGYWREGLRAKAGDAFASDGCLWVANVDTPAKPSAESKDWTLAARQGRPGEAARPAREPRAGTVQLESAK